MDLYQELLKAIQLAELRPEIITYIQNNKRSNQCINDDTAQQKIYLSMVLYDLLNLFPGIVPMQIRLALTVATDTTAWFDDIKTTIIPFIKENQNKLPF